MFQTILLLAALALGLGVGLGSLFMRPRTPRMQPQMQPRGPVPQVRETADI